MTADDVTLTEAERSHGSRVDGRWQGALMFSEGQVKRILANRLAAVQADLADARGSLDMALASARDRLARAESAERRLAEVGARALREAADEVRARFEHSLLDTRECEWVEQWLRARADALTTEGDQT